MSNKPQWHTLEERKPTDGQYCLLTIRQKLGTLVPAEVFLYTGKFFYPGNEFESDYIDGLKPEQVLAWMPLPQPYRKES